MKAFRSARDSSAPGEFGEAGCLSRGVLES